VQRKFETVKFKTVKVETVKNNPDWMKIRPKFFLLLEHQRINLCGIFVPLNRAFTPPTFQYSEKRIQPTMTGKSSQEKGSPFEKLFVLEKPPWETTL